MNRLALLLLLPALGCRSAAQEPPVLPERTSLADTLAQVRTAVGSGSFARKGAAVTVSGHSFALGIESDVHLTLAPGGNFVHRVTGPLGNTVGFDGITAWEQGYDGTVRELALEEYDEELFVHWILTGHWLVPEAPFEIAWAAEDVDGTLLSVALAGTPMEARLRIDPDTGLPTEMRRRTNAGVFTRRFTDWRDVGGLRFAHEMSWAEEDGPQGWTRWTTRSTPPTFVRSPYAAPRGSTRDTSFTDELSAELETQKLFTGHLLVYPTVEGEDVGAFIFDTGAGGMCIDASVADDLGLDELGEVLAVGVSGKQVTGFRRGELFELGRLRFEDPMYVELDLAFLEDIFGEEIAGIVGYEVFARSVVELETATGRASLHDPADYRLAEGAWQELVIDERTPAVQGAFEGHSGYFRLDTGSGGTVTFHTPTVERLDLLEGRELGSAMAGGVGGASRTWSGTIDWFELAGHRFEDPRVEFAGTAIGGLADRYTAGNLGQGFLGPFRMVVDYGNERIAFVPLDGDG